MAKLFNIYWYNEEAAIRRAALFNLRDRDLSVGGEIKAGEIVAGQCGFAVAEANVVGFSGRTVKFASNRSCEWQGRQLRCMALNGLPAGPVSRGQEGGLRHKHCVVAELATPELQNLAKTCGLPVVQSADGRHLANLELASIPGRQPGYRRAKLL